MWFPEYPQFHESGTYGGYPVGWTGSSLPDGDAVPFSQAPLNSVYTYKHKTTGVTRTFVKRKSDRRDDDWVTLGDHCVIKRVTKTDFTDGGGASGTYTLSEEVPIGGWVHQAVLTDVVAWTGDTTAVITVGDGTDVDRYNTGTPSVFTTVAALDLGVPSGTKIHTVAKAPVITVTGGSDFGLLASSGAFTLRLYYKN